jgi:hypothetical protein
LSEREVEKEKIDRGTRKKEERRGCRGKKGKND